MPLVQGGFGSSSEGRGEKSGNIAEHRGETFSHCHSREGHTHTLSLSIDLPPASAHHPVSS